MTTVTEVINPNINNDISSVTSFSNFMREHYYACKLEMTTNSNNPVWKCGKFSNIVDAEKFNIEENPNIMMRKIIPSKCANPFNSLELGYLSEKLSFPVELTDFVPVKK